MSVAVWPDALPRPLRSGHQAQPVDTRRRQPFESGLPAYRRGGSAQVRQLAVTLILTRHEKAVFDRFHTAETGGGVRPFWMPDPVTDSWPLSAPGGTPLRRPDGAPLCAAARLLCLFADTPPQETLRGMTFTLSFSVWVLP